MDSQDSLAMGLHRDWSAHIQIKVSVNYVTVMSTVCPDDRLVCCTRSFTAVCLFLPSLCGPTVELPADH